MPIDLLRSRRAFSLPAFEPVALDFEPGAELALAEVAAGIGPQPKRRDPVPAPTAGELHRTIERHLRAGAPRRAKTDAAGELRDALAQLRRSIG